MATHTDLSDVAFPSGRPAAIVLDMDGLLLDSERLVRSAWQAASAEVGHVMDDALYGQLLGRNDDDAVDYLAGVFGERFAGETFLRLARARAIEALSERAVPMRPGAAALVGWMESTCIPRAIATSTSTQEARARLESSGLWGRIPVVVCGDQVARGKPAPDIYLHAAAALEVAPAECLALEDSSSGACAAAAAGMTTIVVPDLCPPSDDARARCIAIVSSLEVVERWLKAIWRDV